MSGLRGLKGRTFFFASYQGAREDNAASLSNLSSNIPIADCNNGCLTDDRSEQTLLRVFQPKQNGEPAQSINSIALALLNAKLPNGQPIQTQVNSYTATVIVRVQPRLEAWSEWWSENWKTVLKYVLPSGGGATLIAWLIARNREKNQPVSEERKPKEEKEKPEKD